MLKPKPNNLVRVIFYQPDKGLSVIDIENLRPPFEVLLGRYYIGTDWTRPPSKSKFVYRICHKSDDEFFGKHNCIVGKLDTYAGAFVSMKCDDITFVYAEFEKLKQREGS